jgi:site-specific recombinase XerD
VRSVNQTATSQRQSLTAIEAGTKNEMHMLRHAYGYKLANQGVDTRSLQQYLGHKNIQHTVRYTELSPQRFRDFWKD